ncbi:metabotropic glutamate receptor 4-like isoform X2 [Styela clava]
MELGTMMIDTRAMDSHTIGQIVTEFIPLFSEATTSCSTSKTLSKKSMFAGFIGASSSQVSIETAKLLQVFSVPQISYWSTNPTLSDKTLFPYFFRTIPSDTHQLKAMTQFIKHQGWSYVSVVYEDTHYGSRAYTELEKTLKENGICIAVGYRMSTNLKPDEYVNVLRELKTKQARAVLLFTIEQLASEVLKTAAAHPEFAEHFLWISSDSWTRLLPKNNISGALYENELHGTVGFAPETKSVRGLRNYFTNLTLLQNSNRNPWFAKYISERKNCKLDIELPDRGIRKCSPDERINPDTFVEFPYTEKVANALLSFVYAINEVHKSLCGGKSGICEEMNKMRGGTELAKSTYKMLKNITIQGINGDIFTFDDNQDAHSHYDIYNYRKDVYARNGDEESKWIKVGNIHGQGEKIALSSFFQTIFKGTLNKLDPFVLEIEWFEPLASKVTSQGSFCSRQCLPNEAKITFGAKDCCWKCQTCYSHEFVANGTECRKCNQGMRPNKNFTDCEPAEIIYLTYEESYSIATLILGSIGIVCLLFVSVIYVINKDCPIVKASGKELCFYVLFGILLTLTNCWTIMLPPTTILCAYSRIVISIGPTMMYAALLTKTLRVVIVFRSKILTPKVKLLLQPESQIFLTCLIVLVQAFVLIIWLLTSPPQPQLHHSSDNEIVFKACQSIVQPSILIGLIYPFLLIIICTILATANRNVPTGFNEAQLIGFTMYTTCVIWLAFVPIFITNEENYGVTLMTVSICLSLSACTVLFCMFGPRCYTILFNPEENTSQAVMSSEGISKPKFTITRSDVQSNTPTGQRPPSIWRTSAVTDKSNSEQPTPSQNLEVNVPT